MSHPPLSERGSSFRLLRRLAQPVVTRERCELCGILLAPLHRHLWEVAHRHILGACDPCALRFTQGVSGRFKLIPQVIRPLPDFHSTAAQWESFGLPINLAVFVRDSGSGKVPALCPSPAGAIESLLAPDLWDGLDEARLSNGWKSAVRTMIPSAALFLPATFFCPC